MTATAAVNSGAVLPAAFMSRVPDVALPVTSFVCLEMVEGAISVSRKRASVTMTRVETIVDVAKEAMRPVEPGSCTEKDPADEPIRPIVAVGGTVIGGVIEVTVGARGGCSNADNNLGWCC
jgi:hypothetical protein